MNAHSILEKTQGLYSPQVIHAEEMEPGAGNGGSTLQPRLSWQLTAATAACDAGQQAESSLQSLRVIVGKITPRYTSVNEVEMQIC